MPIFEYRCKSCGKVFEQLRSSSDNSIVYCEGCGSDNVVKLFSAFASSGTGSGSSGGGSCGGSGGFS
jgi:putative FmdB family regulatory protein